MAENRPVCRAGCQIVPINRNPFARLNRPHRTSHRYDPPGVIDGDGSPMVNNFALARFSSACAVVETVTLPSTTCAGALTLAAAY